MHCLEVIIHRNKKAVEEHIIRKSIEERKSYEKPSRDTDSNRSESKLHKPSRLF